MCRVDSPRQAPVRGAAERDLGAADRSRALSLNHFVNTMTEATSAHIVTIRREGNVEGYQLRINGGGPGLSRYFAAHKLGGAEKALRAARRMQREMGLPRTQRRGGSRLGRRLSTSKTPAAGIRFEWHRFTVSTVLYVVASWNDKRGRACGTRYSVDRNGFEGALDLAIAKRIEAGAPAPDRKALLKALRAAYRAGDPAARRTH